MTGIPDAVVEAAAKAIHYEYPENGHTWPCDACMSDARAALEAAEGPWREHIAQEFDGIDDYLHWADAAQIVRGQTDA